MELGIASVGAITIIALLIGMCVKSIDSIDNKFIPIICGFTGLILGIVAFVTGMPEFPAKDMITAAAVGTVSGLAATGLNELAKQLNSDK
nr:MAG TPA: holin [Caudoviricetes sp.]